MSAADVAVAVQLGVVSRRVRGDVVRLQVGVGSGVQGAADDLLDLARVQVDAGAESGHCG